MFARPSVVVPQNNSPKTFIYCLEYCLKYSFFNYMFSVHNYMLSVHNYMIYVWKSVHNYMFSVHNYMFRYTTICFPYTTIWFPYTTYSDIVFRTQLYVWNNVWNNVCKLKQYLGPNLDSRSCRAFKNIQYIYIYVYIYIHRILRFGVLGLLFGVQIPNLRRCLNRLKSSQIQEPP